MSTGNEFQAPGSASPAVDYGTIGRDNRFSGHGGGSVKERHPPRLAQAPS